MLEVSSQLFIDPRGERVAAWVEQSWPHEGGDTMVHAVGRGSDHHHSAHVWIGVKMTPKAIRISVHEHLFKMNAPTFLQSSFSTPRRLVFRRESWMSHGRHPALWMV